MALHHHHYRRHILCLLLLLLLHYIQPTQCQWGTECYVGNINFNLARKEVEALVDACGKAVFTEGERCSTTAICQARSSFVDSYICSKNEGWLWAAESHFCPQWEDCVWAGNNLTCIGTRPPMDMQVPANLDPRIRHIEIRNYPLLFSLSLHLAQSVPHLQTLVVTNASITTLYSETLRWISTLTHLDLRDNQLTSLNFNTLPPFGKLRYLDLRGNPDLSVDTIDPNVLHVALTSCDAAEPLHKLWLDVSNCSVERQGACQRVVCTMDDRAIITCDDGQPQPAVRLCDGILDCNDGSDEALCGGTLHVAQANEGEHFYCPLLYEGLAPEFHFRSGAAMLGILPNTDLAHVLAPATEVSIKLIGVTELYNDDGELLGEFENQHLVLVGNFTVLGIENIDLIECRRKYTTHSGSTTTTTTPTAGGSTVAPVQQSGSAAPRSAVIAAVVLVAAAIIFALVARWYVKKHHGAFGQKRDFRLAACVAEAEERFHEVYVAQWPSKGASSTSEPYSCLCVPCTAVHSSSTVLGAGNYGIVSLGTFTPPRHRSSKPDKARVTVAIKTVRATDTAPLVQFLLEARLLHALQPHPYIVQLLAVQETVLPVLLVMEYCELGNLRDFMRQAQLQRFAARGMNIELAHVDLARQVASAVEHLHDRLCLHRDIAARNVLVTAQGAAERDTFGHPLSRCGVVAKLADVGSARVLQHQSEYYRSTSDDTVPVRWQCPIAVDSHVYTSKSDVYSFGVLMYEIFSDGGTPYAELAAGEVLAMVAAGQRLGRPSRTVPEGVVQLIRECTQLSVARRPAMTVVRKWLDKVVRAEDLSQAFVAEHGTTAGWGSSSASWTSGAHTAVGGWDRDADDQHEGEESVL